ncbi:MAG TPA: copper-binding protein, partial [Mycobacterium sp.]|nr:copper-binding protein [Mycobacterium sp.]
MNSTCLRRTHRLSTCAIRGSSATRPARRRRLTSTLLTCVVLAVALHAQPDGQRTFQFRGKVQKVDPSTKTLTVDGENVEGWMAAMTMIYHVDDPQILSRLKVGDTITATVYGGDFSTLHAVRASADAASGPRNDLPPVSYVCPSVGEETYIDDHPGKCPK